MQVCLTSCSTFLNNNITSPTTCQHSADTSHGHINDALTNTSYGYQQLRVDNPLQLKFHNLVSIEYFVHFNKNIDMEHKDYCWGKQSLHFLSTSVFYNMSYCKLCGCDRHYLESAVFNHHLFPVTSILMFFQLLLHYYQLNSIVSADVSH